MRHRVESTTSNSTTSIDSSDVKSPTVTLLSLNNSLVSGNLAPILNFQVILVAENTADDGPSDAVNFSAATKPTTAEDENVTKRQG